MTEVDTRASIDAAIANAANKLARAETIEEAQQWQSIISNLTGTLQVLDQ